MKTVREPSPGSADVEFRHYAERMAEAERIAHFGVWSWDVGSGIVTWSAELHRIYGLEPGEFGGTVEDFVSYLHQEDREPVWSAVEHALHTAQPFLFEERIIRPDGQERVLVSQGRPQIDAEGRVLSLVGVCHDVTERVAAERALGQSERRLRAIINNSPSMVAVKDLDGRYLMANAEVGRILGTDPEELLGKECAALFPSVAEQLRANDLLAVATLEPIYDEAVLEQDGEERTYVVVSFALPDASGKVTETCTIATDVTESRERESVRRERLACQQRIETALREERMLVYGQPVVDVRTGIREGCELLVRMREPGPESEILLPAAFLPAAERFGMIQAIDVWMVEQALSVARWTSPEVNLSAVTLCDDDARRKILSLLRGVPEVASRIVFEITETADPGHLDAAREFAAEVTALGCGMALDDFGTGFGSFTYLHKLPLRYLKIDISFVLGLVGSPEDQQVVQSIIALARHFDLRVIAEGVEDPATLEILRRFGADFVQGFHLGRPAPVNELSQPAP